MELVIPLFLQVGMNERAKRENDDDNNKTRRKDHRTENRENATALIRPSSLDEFGKLMSNIQTFSDSG
jgi:hypothetical protein